MSEPTNNFTANTVLPAAQLNQNITEALNDYRDFTCGTTITAGQAVCINPADGKIYPCDSGYADYRTKNFVGFAVTGGSSSAVIKVQIGGKFAGLSGLTPGDFYYLNTAGTIGTSPGTYQQKVGLAVLSTALIITGSQVTVSTDATMADNSDLEVPSQKAVKTYVDNSLLTVPTTVQTADSNLAWSDNATVNFTNNSPYTKKKEILLNENLGAVNVKFDINCGSGNTAYGKLYKNGVAVGTEITASSGSQTSTTALTNLVAGDLLQVYCYALNGGTNGGGNVLNFRLYFTKTITQIANLVITTPIPVNPFITNPTNNS